MSSSDSMSDCYERERLHFAAQDGDVAEVKRLLEAGCQPDEFDESGKTLLHYAAERGHLQVMEVLIASGADVNAHDERVIGNTPLRQVADDCSYEVAKILIDLDADPTIPGWIKLRHCKKCALKTPGLCSTSCTSTATTPSVFSLRGTATRRPSWIITRIWGIWPRFFRHALGLEKIAERLARN